MLQESDAAELRALQVKAYGRDGGLTEGDAARLRELESSRAEAETPANPETRTSAEVPPAGDAAFEGDPHADGSDVEGADRTSWGSADAGDPGTAASDRESHPSPGLRGSVRQHWKLVAAAAVALVLIGLGAGWALFGRGGDGIALTAEQQERRAQLQSDGDFDPGTLRAIGRDEDALVWFATKQDGKTICLTLDAADKSASQCQPAEDLDNGNGIGVSVTADTADDGSADQVWASAARATTGEILAIVQRWNSGGQDWLSQFSGAERDRAEELLGQGFEEYAVSIVGYVEDAPVWFGQKIEDGDPSDCLIVDHLGAITCKTAGEAQTSGDGIAIEGDWADGSAATEPWSIRLEFTPNGTPYLMITGDLPPGQVSETDTTVKPGETLELGGEYQDPIQVEVPSEDEG
ncbi:hypothetical protein ACTJKH_07025 [Microbacterium sp. 22215]|uniref:hypothetical protein n=1 Tax=Microbacterium sp. 22215 TaxID=3453893 RepID=UPI003F87680C